MVMVRVERVVTSGKGGGKGGRVVRVVAVRVERVVTGGNCCGKDGNGW